MLDRTPISTFGRLRHHRHGSPNMLGIAELFYHLTAEFLFHLPRLWKLRSFYKKRKINKSARVTIFSDNLDEVNGIAINARLVTNRMRELGHDLTLVGTAFHTRENGVVESNGTILLPQRYSMEMPGYDHNELAIPSLVEMTRYLKRYPVDLVEVETPGPGSWMAVILCKVVGIPLVSHYRTDVLAYAELLVSSRLTIGLTRFFTKLFCKLTSPVIVPSEDFRKKMVEDMGLREEQIVRLRRGISLEHLGGDLALLDNWSKFNPMRGGTRFIFVGRVSREKELPFLEKVWAVFRKKCTDAELLIVGAGPYLVEMQTRMKKFPEVRFTGQLEGTELYGLYAEADCLVFPSGTDTFGNVVVESIASATPALVSNSGGPRDIIQNGRSGFVIPLQDLDAWVATMRKVDFLQKENGSEWASLRKGAALRSKDYSLDEACAAQWTFYEDHLKNLHRFPGQ